jgi:hypothetical protein
MRGCTIDGVRLRSVFAGERAAGVSCGTFAYRERISGLEFSFRGHAVVLEPRVLRPEDMPRSGPVDFTARALANRKHYDENGVARAALLARRPA